MATIQPTPSPNPTTDSEETPTSTIQQPQEPVDPQTKHVSPTTDSERAGTELRVPITSETTTNLPILKSDIGLIIGIMVIIIVVTASVVTVVIIIAVLIKKCHRKITTVAVPTTANQAHGLTNTHHNKRVNESIYNYPEVGLDNTIEAKQNEAYVVHSGIIIEGNQAYATNVITKKNASYKPVSTTETIDEYDYI